MAFGWKKYVDDYEKDQSGKYVYVGLYYRFFVEKSVLKRIRVGYAILAAAMVLLFVMAGLNTYLTGTCWYVAIPYAASILPLAFLVMDTVRICRAPERMTKKEYNESVVQHKGACVIMLILAALTTIGDAVFLILNPYGAFLTDYLTSEIIFLVCNLLLAAGAGIWLWLTKKLPCGPEGSRG